jgi:hypothetical protein
MNNYLKKTWTRLFAMLLLLFAITLWFAYKNKNLLHQPLIATTYRRAASLLPPISVGQQLSTCTGFNNNHRDICDRNCHHLHGLIISLRGVGAIYFFAKFTLNLPIFILYFHPQKIPFSHIIFVKSGLTTIAIYATETAITCMASAFH